MNNFLLFSYDLWPMDGHVLNKAIDFQSLIHYSIKYRELLLAALVRKSYLNEHPALSVVMRQEALSTIGDAVIDLLATEHLVRIRRIEDKGAITEERQGMVTVRNRTFWQIP